MKAIIYTKYGSPNVLKLKEIEKPLPKANEILIKNYATSPTSGDVKMRSFKDIPFLPWLPMRFFLGLTKPKRQILGFSVAGVVDVVGEDVKLFKVGDKVFGSTGFNGGSYAEYICLPENGVVIKKSSKMTYEEAAAIPFGALTALHFLKKGNIKKGSQVLIYGASGSLGTYAVQLAKNFGATVTGVCSGKNIKLVKSLGADKVVDYTKGNVFKKNQLYNVIFDTVGKSNFTKSVQSLKLNGIYLRAIHLRLASIIKGIWTQLTSNKKVIGGVASESTENLFFLKELFDQGKLKPVINKRFDLKEMAKAHKYIETGHKIGNVVVKIK